MAMFLSRLKQVLNLGTKSITANGTYTASSDGYDGYSSVSVNVPSVTPTSITPSNSNPAALTSGSAVTPSANGYAIESYTSITPARLPQSVSSGDIVKVGGSGVIMLTPSNLTPSNSHPDIIYNGGTYLATAGGFAIESYTSVTPSSTPASVSSGDIVKIGGNGVIVDSVPTPTSITPSNSNPPSISSGNTYTPTSNGKVVSSVTTLSPSNSNPQMLGGSTPYIGSGSITERIGYAIESYSSKTPSDSSPASVSANSIIKPSSAGYLYASSGLGKCKVGTFTASTSSTTTVNVGFKPKYLLVQAINSAGTYFNICTYNEAVSTSNVYYGYKTTSISANVLSLGSTNINNTITAISSTGFTYNKCSTNYNTTMNYFAIG